MILYQHAVLIVLRDVLIRLGVVLVCTMTINSTSSSGSQCENSISFVLLIFVQMLSTSDGNRGLWPASGYSLMMMMMMSYRTSPNAISYT